MPRNSSTSAPRGGDAPLTDADRAALRAASNFVGTVNGEVELDVRVNHIGGPFPSAYGKGERYLFLLGDDDRNAIRVWGGRSFSGPGGLNVTPQKGDRFKLKAIVQKHEEYEGEKQTTLVKPSITAAA